jgi:hypothetical protein
MAGNKAFSRPSDGGRVQRALKKQKGVEKLKNRKIQHLLAFSLAINC